MKKLQKKFKVTLISTAIAVALGAASMQMVQANNSDSVMLNTSSMSYASDNGHIVLSVAGPEMDVVSTSSKSGSINWNLPANAKDGTYNYEIRVSTPRASSAESDDNKTTKARRVHGSFEVINGLISNAEQENNEPDIPHFDEHTAVGEPSFLKRFAISTLDFLMPVAHAANLSTAPDGDIILEDNSPSLFFLRDANGASGAGTNSAQWQLKVDDFSGIHLDDFILYDDTMNRNVLILRDGTPFRQYWGENFYEVQNMDAGNAPVIRIDKTDSTNTLIVGSGGNVHLANSAVFIDRTNARLGIGTTTPTHDLHVAGGGKIRQDGFGSEYWVADGSDDYTIYLNNGSNRRVMILENDNNACGGAGGAEVAPCVGFFGANNPEASVHIKKSDGHTQLLVEEASGAIAKRYLLQMKNNGPTGFQLTDTSNSKSWQFAQTGSGGFTASQIGSGGPELTVTNEGRVRMGPGSITNFDLQASGNLVIANGSVTANGILLTSSRASKTDIDAIKPAEIMAKLKKVEVAEWRYKKADKNDRHISPMAEDFYALFQLGPDNKHINPNDLASVAIIAAKELQKENKVLKKQLEEKTMALETKNKMLQERLASLEKLVTNLASATGHLSTQGSKIALK